MAYFTPEQLAYFTPEQLAAYVQEVIPPGYDPIQAMIERGNAPLDRSNWDQSMVDYYDQMEAYRQKLSDMGITYQDPGLNPNYDSNLAAAGVSLPNFGQIFASANPQAYYAKLMQASADPTAAFQPFADFATKAEGFGRLPYDPNKQYRMVDGDGRVVYSGTGLEALQQMSQLVPSLSPKASSTWNIDSADVGADNWQPTGVKKVNSDTPGFMKVLGTIAQIAPMFIPGFGALTTLGKMAAMGASGAIGAGAAGRDPLTGALVGGLTAGALNVPLPGMQQGISGALSNAVGGALGAGTQGGVQSAADAAFNGILVNAPSALANTISSVIPGLTNLGVNAATQSAIDAAAKTPVGQQAATQAPTAGVFGGGLDAPFDGITVTGAGGNTFPSSLFGSAIQIPGPAALLNSPAVPNAPTENAPTENAPTESATPEQQDIIVKARAQGVSPDIIANTLRLTAATVGAVLAAAGLSSTAPAATSATSATTPPGGLNDIVVTAAKPLPPPVTGPLSFGVDAATQAAINAAAQPPATPAKPALSTIDKIRLGLAGAGLIGNAIEGTPGSGTVPAGFGSSAQFNGALPTVTLPDSTARTSADMGITSPHDWYRYGYGPEQSFLKGIPQGEKNNSTAFTGYRDGGFAVQGDGDGRSDSIDARLSDGEYVMDAETVALLGNGSNKAGAGKLDRLRVNIRKHKGRKLAKGALSADAKAPERYLAGGLS